MKRPTLVITLTLAMISVALEGKTIKLEAPRCGEAISKDQVTVVDARELSGDAEAMVETLWQEIGPFSAVHQAEVTTRYWKFAAAAQKRAKGIAADMGCDVLIITDKGRMATGNYKVDSYGNVNQVQKGQVIAVYGCRWSGEVQPECPIPQQVLEEHEQQQVGEER